MLVVFAESMPVVYSVGMSDTLRYGFGEQGISLDVPTTVFEEAVNGSDHLSKAIERPAAQRVVEAVAVDDGMRLLFNTKRVGRTKDSFVKDSRGKEMVQAIIGVTAFADQATDDPRLFLQLGSERRGYGVLGFLARATWPDTPPQELEVSATEAMRQVARDFHYVSERLLPEMVYASVSRERGVTLETNPIGSCSIDTSGNEYMAEEPEMFLYGHNLYTYEMQLMCLSGLITIVRG